MFSVSKNLNNYAGRWRFLDLLGAFFARYFLYVSILFLLVISLFKKDYRFFFYPVFAGFIATFVVARLVYLFYKKDRPSELKRTTVLIPIPRNPSFPSSHASFTFGLAFPLFIFNFQLGIIFLIFAVLVSVSRVFCGVHWFKDVLGGIVVGLVSALISNYLLTYGFSF